MIGAVSDVQGRRQVCKSGGAGMLLRCKCLDILPSKYSV